MNIDRAKEILELLADGVNPLTGELLPDSDSCNQVEVVRAFHTALKHWMQPREKLGNRKRRMPGSPGCPRMTKTYAGCSTQAVPQRNFVCILEDQKEPLQPDWFALEKLKNVIRLCNI